MAKKITGKTWVVTERWKNLTRDEQIAEVRKEMTKPGTSNKSAATALGATPGMVAGIRYKNDIPSTNKPGLHAEPEAAPALNRPLLKMAASEATQCRRRDNDNHQCGCEREPDSYFCLKHQPKQKLHARKK